MCGGGGVSFLKGVASGRLTVMEWVAPHPGVNRQHKLKSAGYKNHKTRAQSWRSQEVGVGGSGRS